MSVFGMNVKAQVLDEGLNRLGKWKVELVPVSAMILLAWLVKEMRKTKVQMPIGLAKNSSPIPTSIEPSRGTQQNTYIKYYFDYTRNI